MDVAWDLFTPIIFLLPLLLIITRQFLGTREGRVLLLLDFLTCYFNVVFYFYHVEKLGCQKLASLGDYVVPLCNLFKGGATPCFYTQFWMRVGMRMRRKRWEKVWKKIRKKRKKNRKKMEREKKKVWDACPKIRLFKYWTSDLIFVWWDLLRKSF